MVKTKNKIKSDKQKLLQIKDENQNLRKIYEANLKLFQESDVEKVKNEEVKALKEQV